MKLIRLTQQDFDSIAPKTRLGHQALEMARSVLVDARSQADVAREYGMTKQRVGLAVASIERAYKESAIQSTANVRVELDIPERLALELGAFVDAIKESTDSAKSSEAIEKITIAVRKAAKYLKQ